MTQPDGSAARRVALHAAWIGRGAAALADLRGRGQPPLRPGRPDLDLVAARAKIRNRCLAHPAFSTTSTPGRASRGQNEAMKCSECQAGASIASCRFMPACTWRREAPAIHWSC